MSLVGVHTLVCVSPGAHVVHGKHSRFVTGVHGVTSNSSAPHAALHVAQALAGTVALQSTAAYCSGALQGGQSTHTLSVEDVHGTVSSDPSGHPEAHVVHVTSDVSVHGAV